MTRYYFIAYRPEARTFGTPRRDAESRQDDELFREGEHSGLADIERAESEQEERE